MTTPSSDLDKHHDVDVSTGAVIVVGAGVTSSEGVFEGKPYELEVQVGNFVIYDPPSLTFRITAEPKNKKMKGANYFPKKVR